MGINFIDTIVVRRSLNKGTSSTTESTSKAEFMGGQNTEKTDDRMKLAGDLWIMSGKGTTKIKLSEMEKSKTADIKAITYQLEKELEESESDSLFYFYPFIIISFNYERNN